MCQLTFGATLKLYLIKYLIVLTNDKLTNSLNHQLTNRSFYLSERACCKLASSYDLSYL